MKVFSKFFWLYCAIVLAAFPAMVSAAEIDRFIGNFAGTAEFSDNGKAIRRDMNVEITRSKKGFNVTWTSSTYKNDGRIKEKSYTIAFVPSERTGIFASAMKVNVFGKSVPLNPLKGEPFVWSRFEGETFTVFSLFIDEVGGYDMQEYHRTLAEGGLKLEFRSLRNGTEKRTITTFLKRQ